MKKLELEKLFEKLKNVSPRRFSYTIENKTEGEIQATLSTRVDDKLVVIKYEEETESELDPAGGGRDDIKRSYYTLTLRERGKLRSYDIPGSTADYIHRVLIDRRIIILPYPGPTGPLGDNWMLRR